MNDLAAPVDRLRDDGSVVIFLFHGVIEQARSQVRNYTRKHLPVSRFRGILEELARRGEPLTMDQVTAICVSGQPFPTAAFAITFDDGFENNVSVARPVLEWLGIPATLYVTSRFIDENGMSWIDRIEWAIENASRGSLRLPWAREPMQFADIKSKIAVLDDIRRNVKSNPDLDPDKLVSDIFRQLDLGEIHSSDDPLDRKMNWRQVREWISPGFIIGGHGHTHSILSFLAPARLDWELDLSLRMMRERAGLTARHYSYPEGLVHCYSPQVIAALRRREIICSPTAIDGVNPPAADPFHLRRVMVS